MIFLGRSKKRFDSKPRNVGLLDDAHLVTCGQSGSGKSVFSLYNNGAIWPGSLFQLDPKGEIAKHTMAARLHHNFQAGVLDPFGVRDLQGISDKRRWRFNPLAEIDINDPLAVGIINTISDGCTIPSNSGDDVY